MRTVFVSLTGLLLAGLLPTACYAPSTGDTSDAGDACLPPCSSDAPDPGEMQNSNTPDPRPEPPEQPIDPNPPNTFCQPRDLVVSVVPVQDVAPDTPTLVDWSNGDDFHFVAWIPPSPEQELLHFAVVDDAGEAVLEPLRANQSTAEVLSFATAWNAARKVFELFYTRRAADGSIDTERIVVDPYAVGPLNSVRTERTLYPLPGVVDDIAITDTGRLGVVYNGGSFLVEEPNGTVHTGRLAEGDTPAQIEALFDRLFLARGDELVVWTDANGLQEPRSLPLFGEQTLAGLVRLNRQIGVVWKTPERYGVTLVLFAGGIPSAPIALGTSPPRAVGAVGTNVWWFDDDGAFSTFQGTVQTLSDVPPMTAQTTPGEPVATLDVFAGATTFFSGVPLEFQRLNELGEVESLAFGAMFTEVGRRVTTPSIFADHWSGALQRFRYYRRDGEWLVEEQLDGSGNTVGANRWKVSTDLESGCMTSFVAGLDPPTCITVDEPEPCGAPASVHLHRAVSSAEPERIATFELPSYDGVSGCAYPVVEDFHYDDLLTVVTRRETPEGPEWWVQAIGTEGGFDDALQLGGEPTDRHVSSLGIWLWDAETSFWRFIRRQPSRSIVQVLDPIVMTWRSYAGLGAVTQDASGAYDVRFLVPNESYVGTFEGELPDQLVMSREVWGIWGAQIATFNGDRFSAPLGFYGAESIVVDDIGAPEVQRRVVSFRATSARGVERHLMATLFCR